MLLRLLTALATCEVQQKSYAALVKGFIYLFLEEGEERERVRERNTDRLLLVRPDLRLHRLGIPTWDDAQPAEPQGPRQLSIFF